MKNTVLFLLLFACNSLFALAPWESATLYNHLLEVNPRWKYVSEDRPEFDQLVAFANESDRIYAHLKMVEVILLEKTDEVGALDIHPHRSRLIKILAAYREAKTFPVNHYHKVRRPYFIDNFGTACAVGHLIQKTGHEAFAAQISREMNFAYIMDMAYPQLHTWAEQYGFTREELALIQPGYSPRVTWESMGAGADGEITAMHGDEENQRLIVGGNFSTLDGIACKQIAVYEGQTFSPLGDGVVGEIRSMALFEGNIYLGGLFENNANIAFWDGQTWTYERFGSGTVQALHVFGEELIAGGDFVESSNPADSLGYIARKGSAGWQGFGTLQGPVYDMEVHQGQLHVAGDLLDGSNRPMYVKKLDMSFGVAWVPAANPQERLDNVVRSLASDGTYLYAAGDCFDAVGNTTFGFARLGNSGWERLIDPEVEGMHRHSLKKVFVYEGAVLLAGDYDLQPLVGIYGGGVSEFHPDPVYPALEAWSEVDSTVQSLAYVNGELFIGGMFKNNGREAANHLLKTGRFTSINRRNLIQARFFPNPMEKEARLKLEGLVLPSRVEAYDISGRQVHVSYGIEGQELVIQREQLQPGLLFVRLFHENKILAYGKLMVK